MMFKKEKKDMITDFKQFINESIRGAMIGKSEDEVRHNFDGLDLEQKLNYIERYHLDDKFLPTDEEIEDYLLGSDTNYRMLFVKNHKLDKKFLPSDDDIKTYLSTLDVMTWLKDVRYHNLDDKFLPTTRQINKSILDETNIRGFFLNNNRKATLIPSEDKTKIQLKSYNTIVAEYNLRTKKLKVYGWYSSTTARQINKFIDYLGGGRHLSKYDMSQEPTIKI